MTSPLITDTQGHIRTLTLNRPESRNPISDDDMVNAIVDACDAINRDLSIRAVIVTGAGKGFSAGGNIKHMREQTGMFAGDPAQIVANYRHGIQRIPRAVYELEVPTIAAVNGAAVGAGCDLAMMCDIRLAGPHAKFAESFVKLGIVPGDGGAWFLPRTVGWQRAAEMLFTGDTIDAHTALSWGMVSRLCEGDTLMEEAFALAERIAQNPPRAVRASKKLLREAQADSLATALESAARAQAIAHHTDEHREALASFFAQSARKE